MSYTTDSSLKIHRLSLMIFLASASLFLVSFGCTDFGTQPDNSPNNSGGGVFFDTVYYAGEIRDTLVKYCGAIGCHGGGTVQGGLLMGSFTWNEITNASGDHGPIIVPGDASTSNLYLKLTTTPLFGVRMPNGGPYLTTEFQQLVQDWIDQGALDN